MGCGVYGLACARGGGRGRRQLCPAVRLTARRCCVRALNLSLVGATGYRYGPTLTQLSAPMVDAGAPPPGHGRCAVLLAATLLVLAVVLTFQIFIPNMEAQLRVWQLINIFLLILKEIY